MAQPPELDDDLPPSAVAVADSGPKSQAGLDDLVAKATAKYAVKDWAAAAELYSRATELQAELNGEMSTKNAELLYLYGRCLYHVAVQNSDVLGAKVAGEEKKKQKKQKQQSQASKVRDANEPGASSLAPVAEGAENAADSAVQDEGKQTGDTNSNPYFSITGDENWDDSDDDDDAADENGSGDEDGDAEDPEDDFSNAFEVLDIARVLLEKRLSELDAAEERLEAEEKAKDLGEAVLAKKRLKTRLADTRDLQAEISLEAERFTDAAADLEVALKIMKEIYPFESSAVAEVHFKLSLALEFSSITPATDQNGDPQPGTVGKIDQSLREKAAEHMAEAIKSCKARIELEEKLLKVSGSDEYTKQVAGIDKMKTVKITRNSIAEVQDMVTDMEQRLKELKEAPVSVQEASNKLDPTQLSGLLGSLVGADPDAQRAKLEEAVGKANDLSGLVKKKKQPSAPAPAPAPTAAAQGEKRKAEDADADTGPESRSAEKKARQ